MAFKNLAAEMAREGISDIRLAEVAMVTPRTVYNWRTGKSDPSLTQCWAIKRKLFPDLSLDYLFVK